MNALTRLQPMRDTLQTLLLHQKLTDETQIFVQALRMGDFAHAIGMMTEVWSEMSPEFYQSMVESELPAFAKSTATFVGLIMDDGQEAVVDAFLYFSNDKWAACDLNFILQEETWKVSRLDLKEIDWSIEPFSSTTKTLSSRNESLELDN